MAMFQPPASSGLFNGTSIVDNTTTGANQTISAAGAYFYILGGSVTSINFISNGTTGQVLVLKNATGSAITLVYNTSINGGIITPTGANIPVPNGGAIELYNDAVHGYWYTTGAGYVDAILPDQTGNSGEFLKSNGTTSSWATVSSNPKYCLPKNYLSAYNGNTGNGDFELGATTGWVLGNIPTITNGLPASTSPTFGSGANANLSFTTVSSSQLAGTYSGSYVSSSATTQGDSLASSAFTIDTEDQAKVMTVKFYYTAHSGGTNMNFTGTSSNSYAWAVWDATNSVWLPTAGQFNLTQSSGVGYCTGTFQTNTTTASVRFVLYNCAATAGAATLYVDDFFLGPQTAPIGVPATDWQSQVTTFTSSGSAPTKGVMTTDTLEWRRVGGNMEFRINFNNASGSSSGTGDYSIAIPSGLAIDTTKLTVNATVYGATDQRGADIVGNGSIFNGSSTGTVRVYVATSTTLKFDLVGAGVWSASSFPIGTSTYLSVTGSVPILGWSSNVQMSSDTDTRVVAALSNNATATITGSYSNVTWGTIVNDTHGAMGAINYTIPVTGYYDISAQTTVAGTQALNGTAAIQALKNGSIIQENDTGYAGALTANSTMSVDINAVSCKAGDTISIQIKSSATSPVIADGTNGCFFSIARRSGPSIIAATESVNMSYTDVSGVTVSSAYTTWIFPTKSFDSHGAYGTSGVYMVPVSGKYQVECTFAMNPCAFSTTLGLFVILNHGSSQVAGGWEYGNVGVTQLLISYISKLESCNAGDTLAIQVKQTGASGVIGYTGAGFYVNNLSIFRAGN